jgi:hypothetical protein
VKVAGKMKGLAGVHRPTPSFFLRLKMRNGSEIWMCSFYERIRMYGAKGCLEKKRQMVL